VDVARFQWLIAEPEQVYSTGVLDFDCQPKLDGWVPPRAYVHNPKRKAGDFFKLVPGALVCSPRAVGVLRGVLEMAGELLPLPVEGHEVTVLNVLECVNCLDEGRSDFDSDRARSRYVFLPERLSGSTLFKVPRTAAAEILTVEGRPGNDPEEEFEPLVEANNLTGLVFELVWEGEG
jgi:hypothetical protein